MHSDNADATLVATPVTGTVRRLLDPAFGFFVWLAHFVVIYVANAVTCGLRLTSEGPGAGSVLVLSLTAVTVGAAMVVALHGVKRFRALATAADAGFLLRVAVGNDAIAAFAILWQLIPIFMSPVCQ